MSRMKALAHRIFKEDRFALCILAVAFCVVFFASTYRLSESPGIWYDEGYYTQLAMNLADSGRQSIQTSPGIFSSSATVTGGFPLTLPVALSYKLFGVGVLQGRGVMVVYIIALLFGLYLAVRALFGSRMAAWSTLLVASFPLLYGNGKSVLGEIPGLFFLVLTLFVLTLLERNHFRKMSLFAFAGLAAGLCVVTKPIFLLFLPAIFFSYIFAVRRFSFHGFISGVVAFCIPLALWLYLQFGGGDSFSSVLSFYINPYEIGNVSSLFGQNLLKLFTDATPLLILALVIVWCTSFALRLYARISIYRSEYTAFLFCLTVIAAYLRLPGWYRYLFPAGFVALLFLPNSLHVIFNFLATRFNFLKPHIWVVAAFLIVATTAQLYQLASTSYVAGYYGSHRTHDVQKYISTLDPSASFFLYNVPELAVLLPNRNYFQYLQPHELKDSETLGLETLPVLAKGEVEYVAVSDSFYHSYPEIFSAYGMAERVNRYDFLKKK